jgi:hypothetical protein
MSPNILEQLRQAGLSPGFFGGYFTALPATLVLAFSIVAAVIFWRKSDDWMGIFASLTLVLFGTTFNSDPFSLIGKQYPALLFLSSFLTFLGPTCLILFFYLFPDGRFAPRWIWLLVPLVFVHQAVLTFWPDLLGGVDWYFWLVIVSAISAQIYRYRRISNLVQRQQTKWVVLGTAVSGLLFVAIKAFASLALQNQPLSVIILLLTLTAGALANALIPLSIGMAILRSHLWNIDILIRRTLVYAVLTGLLAVAYFGSVLVLEGLVRLLTGQSQSQVVTVASTLAIAALFVLLRRRVQAFIDRRFYRRKYDAAQTLAAFSNSVRDEVELGRLAERLTEVVEETLQPESVGLWLK